MHSVFVGAVSFTLVSNQISVHDLFGDIVRSMKLGGVDEAVREVLHRLLCGNDSPRLLIFRLERTGCRH